MVNLNVTVKGLPVLLAKLDPKYLLEPEMEAAVQRIADRPFRAYGGLKTNLKTGVTSRRGGASFAAGIRNNSLMASRSLNVTTIDSTLNQPRTSGSAWVRYNIAAMRSMAPGVLNSAAKKIEARWSA